MAQLSIHYDQAPAISWKMSGYFAVVVWRSSNSLVYYIFHLIIPSLKLQCNGSDSQM